MTTPIKPCTWLLASSRGSTVCTRVNLALGSSPLQYNDNTIVQYASGNLTPIELMHVHREGEGEVEGEGEGVVVKTLSSSYEPPRAWARERRSKQASPCSTS